MPVTPFEIMLAKVWAMGLVVLLASAFALRFIVEGWLQIPIQGSLLLFIGAALHLFATTSMGIFFGTVARSMPQLGLLIILALMPLQILSGGMTRASMPSWCSTSCWRRRPALHRVGPGDPLPRRRRFGDLAAAAGAGGDRRGVLCRCAVAAARVVALAGNNAAPCGPCSTGLAAGQQPVFTSVTKPLPGRRHPSGILYRRPVYRADMLRA